MSASVLVFTPTWLVENMPAMHPQCHASIEAQRMSVEMTWSLGWDNDYPIPDHRNVLLQYQRARESFLAGDYDALITVEHDQRLPDPLALQRLFDTPGDVVYAPYLLRHGIPLLNTWQYVGQRNLGMSLSNYPDELAQARAAGIWRISGAGMGCTLFRRAVLEAIPFEATDPQTNACPDLGFATAALRAGFVSVGRFDVPVAHYARGRWLVPFEEVAMNYIARETGQASAGGRIIRLKAGVPIALNDEEARDLLSLGKVVPRIELPALVDETPIAAALSTETAEVVVPVPQVPRRKRARDMKA